MSKKERDNIEAAYAKAEKELAAAQLKMEKAKEDVAKAQSKVKDLSKDMYIMELEGKLEAIENPVHDGLGNGGE